MDEGTVADFNVKALVLSHNPETRKAFAQAIKPLKKQQRYAAEKTFLFNHDKRNLFIRNLVWSLKGQNNLILFDQIEKHGKILEPMLRRDDRVLHFIHGGVSGEARENVRHVVENDNTIKIKFYFGDIEIEVYENEEVPLSNGSIIKAKEVNENHDISDKWIHYKTKSI
jgi:hypothetical protein